MLGSNIPEKNFCAEGFYLVANPGDYLVNQTRMLLLRNTNHEMISDQSLVGNRARIQGIYPAQEAFCKALICGCEDFILVKEISRE